MSKSASKIISDSVSVIEINFDSLTIVTPGSNGIAAPTVITPGIPKAVETNTNIVSAAKPKIILSNLSRKISVIDNSTIHPLNIPAIRNKNLQGIPEVVVAKDPFIRDRNPQNFCTYAKQQGLKNSFILCMIQDKIGNIWFSTYAGLAKFNGKTFTYYTMKEGLSGNPIRAILEDRHGNLWLGTYGGGVTKYNGKDFFHYTENEGFLNNKVRAIIEDSNGNIWFGTDNGISKYDGSFFTHYNKKQGLTDPKVSSIIEDHWGYIWIGTHEGNIYRLSQDRKTFVEFSEKDGLSNHTIRSIAEDCNANIWFGTSGGGVLKFNGKTFSLFTEKEGLSNNNVWSIAEDKNGNIWFGTDVDICKFDGDNFTHFSQDEGLLQVAVKSIVEDNNGNLWFGTYGSGIAKFNGKLFTHLTEKEGLPNNIVRAILEDRKGNIWLGTYRGLCKYDGKKLFQFTVNQGLTDDNIRSLYEDHDGNIWIGTNAGLNKYDGKTFTQYTVKQGLSNNSILSIFEDSKENLWLGTWGAGAIKFDGKSFTHFTQQDGLSNNFVWSITEDNEENIWFGTEGGATKFDGKTFKHFTQANGLLNNIVWSIEADKSNNLWFGTLSGITILTRNSKSGINSIATFDGYKIMSLTENEGLSGKDVLSMLVDNSGNFFFGTGSGLSKINAGYLKDLDSLIINAQNPSTPIFKNFAYEDGFLGIGVNEGKSLCETRDGNIWIGASDRLTIYYPQGNNPDTVPPNVQLLNIELFNEKINWACLTKTITDTNQRKTDISIDKDTNLILGNGVKMRNFKFDGITPFYSLPQNLSLAFNNNFITFDYIGITQKQSRLVKYQYKLEGIDENWSAITTRTTAPYGNLPHGEYTFKVKAMNSDGFWSKEFSYPFIIRPPWWKTIWFKVLSVLVLLFVLFVFYRWRLASLTLQKKQLEKVIEEKTIEILNQNEELKALNEEQHVLNEELSFANKDLCLANEELSKQRIEIEATLNSLKMTQNQLIQSEKMASLGILSAGIAHEVNNPLNFIKGGYFGMEEYIKESLPEHLENISPYLSAINTGVERAVDIVNSLGAYSRKDELIKTTCSPHKIIDNCLVMLNNRLKYKVEIKKIYSSGDPMLFGNEGKLHQAFLNILANAEQAIEKNGVITINTEVVSNDFITRIADNGCGIDKDNMEKIFEPFFTTKEPGKGTGLGLSIAHKIILEHNGSLEYESEVGKGTTAIIKLPLAK